MILNVANYFNVALFIFIWITNVERKKLFYWEVKLQFMVKFHLKLEKMKGPE